VRAGLAARLLLQPLEENDRLLFPRQGALVAIGNDVSGRDSKKEEGSVTFNLLQDLEDSYFFLLRVVLYIGFLFSAIGSNYSSVLLRLLAGNRWGSNPEYTAFLALNGITEAFVYGVARSGNDVRSICLDCTRFCEESRFCWSDRCKLRVNGIAFHAFTSICSVLLCKGRENEKCRGHFVSHSPPRCGDDGVWSVICNIYSVFKKHSRCSTRNRQELDICRSTAHWSWSHVCDNDICIVSLAREGCPGSNSEINQTKERIDLGGRSCIYFEIIFDVRSRLCPHLDSSQRM
jgi:hypothetical protein